MEALLQGTNADWSIDEESVRIQFGRGLLVPRLHKALGMIVVPFEAVSGVVVNKGWQGKVALRLLLRPGADPLLAAGGGQFKEREDPYRLVLPAAREGVAGYHADELRLRAGLAGLADRPAERFLLQGPSVPRQVKGYDGDGYFDGTTVTFNWNWSAKSSKRKAGSQRFDISQIQGVEWSRPDDSAGHLSLRVAGWPPAKGGPKADLATLVLQMGQGELHQTLPFAAAVLARLPEGPATPAPLPPSLTGEIGGVMAPAGDRPATPAVTAEVVAEGIRKLGELRDAGLLSEAEFQAKKTELLGRL